MGGVAFLGVEGAGKTVLTSAFISTFKQHAADGWSMMPLSRESFRFLESLPSRLAGEGLPQQTTSLRRMSWGVNWNGKEVQQLEVLDFPGEFFRLAFLDEDENMDPSGFEQKIEASKDEVSALLEYVAEASLVFVLFNMEDAKDLAHDQMNVDAVWATMSCLRFLSRLPSKPHVVLLLTQIDKYVDLRKDTFVASTFLKERVPVLYETASGVDVMAVSALGSADEYYGVDSVILKFMGSSEGYQTFLQGWQDSSERIGKRLSGPMKHFIKDSRVVLDDIAQCQQCLEDCPWFAKEILVERDLLVDKAFINDLRSIVKAFLPLSGDAWKMTELEFMQQYVSAVSMLDRVNAESEMGQSVAATMRDRLKAGIDRRMLEDGSIFLRHKARLIRFFRLCCSKFLGRPAETTDEEGRRK